MQQPSAWTRMSGQQAGPTSQGSMVAMGEETIGSVVNTPASSQGSATAPSAEQRPTRQIEASSRLALLAGTALAFQLTQPQTQTGTESAELMCAVCGMLYDVDESVTRFKCGHHYHTVCINTWQCHHADRQREQMRRHQQQGQDPWCPFYTQQKVIVIMCWCAQICAGSPIGWSETVC